jgi:hypothetical protein
VGKEKAQIEESKARRLLVVCNTRPPAYVPEADVTEGEDAAPWISWRTACRLLCTARAVGVVAALGVVLLRSLRRGVEGSKNASMGRLMSSNNSGPTQGLVNSMILSQRLGWMWRWISYTTTYGKTVVTTLSQRVDLYRRHTRPDFNNKRKYTPKPQNKWLEKSQKYWDIILGLLFMFLVFMFAIL